MKTHKKFLTKTRVEISVVLDADELAAASDKAVARLADELKIKGFRKGKVPIKVARKHIPENDLAGATLDMAVRTAIPKVFSESKVQAISVPEVSVDKYVPGELVEFRATSDILPEVKLGNYKTLKAKKESTKLTVKSVDEVLGNIAKSFAEKKAVNRAAKLGDEVQIDFVGKVKDEAFEGGSSKDFKLELGSKQFIPGFEEGIVGHKPGDKFEIKLTFPKEYHADKLAGKKATFDVLLKQVNALELPKIDDELAKKTGPFKTLKELKADIEKNLKSQNEHTSSERYKDALVNELVSISTVEAPEILISDQLKSIKNELEKNLKTRNITEEQYFESVKDGREGWEKQANAAAEQRAKAALVLGELAKELKILASDDLVDAKITELKEVYKKNPEAMKNLEDPRIAVDVKHRLTIEQTVAELEKINSK